MAIMYILFALFIFIIALSIILAAYSIQRYIRGTIPRRKINNTELVSPKKPDNYSELDDEQLTAS
jgi:uncharacterized membrane protein